MYAPFTPPHGRFEAPDAKPYEDNDWPQPAKYLASMVTRLDRSVGMILDRVRQHGLDENTIVIFASDNGPGALGVKHFESNGPFRGFKRDMYEGGIRVPFLVRWKGKIQPGETAQIITFWDFLPTVCELLHTATPPGIDGLSFLPTLLGNFQKQKQHEYLYWEFFERGFQQAVREGDWKGIRLKQGTPLELYNLASDVQEKHNVAADHSDIVRKLEQRLRTCRTVTERWG